MFQERGKQGDVGGKDRLTKAGHRMGMRRTVLLLASTALAVLLACGVSLVLVEQQARAAFPGANGKIAFYSDRSYNYPSSAEIFATDADGSSPINLTNDSVIDTYPAWSPDGSKIAFMKDVSGNGGANYEIFVMNADGSRPVNLTKSPAYESKPTWSPDGLKIAFVGYSAGNYDIWVMNADGSNPTKISNTLGSDDDPAWSPDGSKIAFHSNRTANDGTNDNDIWVMNPDGSNPVNLTNDINDGNADLYPDWSPDGSKIAFVSARGGPSSDIYTMQADGSDKTRLTDNNSVVDTYPAWSPDGSKIAFTTDRDRNYEVYSMNADGSAQQNVSNNPSGDQLPTWQPLPPEDTTPPETVIDSGPSGYVSSTSASFSFSSSKPDSTFQCSSDGSVFATCTSPVSYSGLSQGNHTFQVIAIDALGNTDATPASHNWFVDTVAPSGTVSINGGNTRTTSPYVTLDLSASDPAPASRVANMRFKNEDRKATWSGWVDYSTSQSWTLTTRAGKKTVYVQYKDQAGNVSATASDSIVYKP
jgi:Tol biopolymer transport system component